MDTHKQQIWRQKAERVIEALARNNMKGYYVERCAEVPAKVASLLRDGDTVAVGGSMTLRETGVLELLHSGRYRFLDRYASGLTPEQVRQVFIDSFSADAYLASANAVTLNGEIYNVDGNSNRIAAISFGPRRVILVVSCDKIVRDIEEAAIRVKSCAAPANAVRLGCHTFCAENGVCAGLRGTMTAGCSDEQRICANYLICARQREKDRIQVILVGEETGY